MYYLTFPIWNAVRAELSWNHYRLTLSLEDEKGRDSYINETIEGNWSTRQLESIICHLMLKAHTVYAELILMRIYIRNVDKSYRLEWRVFKRLLLIITSLNENILVRIMINVY